MKRIPWEKPRLLCRLDGHALMPKFQAIWEILPYYQAESADFLDLVRPVDHLLQGFCSAEEAVP